MQSNFSYECFIERNSKFHTGEFKMKLFAALLTLTFAASFAKAETTELVSLAKLSCAASNGVTIQSTRAREAGLGVKAELGLLTSKFTAAVAVDENQKTSVELTNNQGRVEYLLDLALDLDSAKLQRSKIGTIIRTGDGVVGPLVVASVLCDVRLK